MKYRSVAPVIGSNWRFACLLTVCLLPASGLRALDVEISDRVVTREPYEQRRISYPQGVSAYVDVPYAEIAGYRPLALDVYFQEAPASAAPKPLIVYIHGGGWRAGNSRLAATVTDWPGTLAALAAEGFVTASVNYRLSGEAQFPAPLLDVKAAVRWLRANAGRFGIDTGRVILWGASAGAHLAALAATTCNVRALEPDYPANPEASAPSSCVQAAVLWYGPFDLSLPMADQPAAAGEPETPEELLLGCRRQSCPLGLIDFASPVSHVDGSDPPMLLIHGVEDSVVPVAQSRRFYAKLQEVGGAGELLELPGVDHSFVGADARRTRAASRQAMAASIRFTRTILSGRQSPAAAP